MGEGVKRRQGVVEWTTEVKVNEEEHRERDRQDLTDAKPIGNKKQLRNWKWKLAESNRYQPLRTRSLNWDLDIGTGQV